MSALDISSNYPYNMCGRLPTMEKSIKVKGTIEPNEEYPFAFYLKSGHSAEYGVYDTHKWKNSKFRDSLYRKIDTHISDIKSPIISPRQNWDLEPNEDITLLCKASKCELTNIYEWFYKCREESKINKLIANASIGYMAKRDYRDYKLAHLRTVCICRANENMRRLCEDNIGIRNIIMIQVDGVIYNKTKCFGIGKEDKCFGSAVQEYNNCIMSYSGVGQYIFMKDKELVSCKHQGYNDTIDGSDIEEPTTIHDITKWVKKTKIGADLYEEE